VPPPVDTNKVDVPVPPDARVTLAGVRIGTGPFLMEGEMLAERVTVPANPLRLVTLMAELPDCPLIMVSDDGVALMVKSGGAETIVNEATVKCDRLPLAPVTLTPKVPVGPPAVVVNVSVDDACPPDDSVTLVGLMLQPGQLAQAS
jgi:hypothetical protein